MLQAFASLSGKPLFTACGFYQLSHLFPDNQAETIFRGNAECIFN
jgi:hypothetical protein